MTVPAAGTRAADAAAAAKEATAAAKEDADVEKVKHIESAATLFKIDCTDVKSAVRSILKMQQRIVSMMLAENAPNEDDYETVTPLHLGRIRYDEFGEKIPVFWRTLPHVVWLETVPPV